MVEHNHAEYYDAYWLYNNDDKDAHKKMSVKTVAITLDTRLRHGDIVNCSKFNGPTLIVVENKAGARRFVESERGHMNIPYAVTKRIKDVEAFYKDVIKDYADDDTYIEIGAHDVAIKKIFKKPSVILQKGKFAWYPIDNKLLIEYNNQSEMYPMKNVTQEEIDMDFGVSEYDGIIS